ncbi:nicotinamide N-methyltransferase-like isoform X1 [Rana temporaria]|uniref:nicotinamide N-methyltransferase-like isoform X1 n=1 Tax=Rana temporaria TaxID=8407 RepID=UPI001AACFAF2|nr:nicotinamide N-methyltransferase-like isoform X1 [Rana temporaria]
MEPGSHKLYHVHGFHSRNLLDTYFSSKPGMPFAHEALRYPMEKFYNAFCSGDFRGDVLIDISAGPIIQHLYAALEYFRDIILLKPTEHCILEVKKWTDSRTGAFDWSHTTTLATELAGKSDQCEEKEIGLKAAITHVVKFDINKENLTDPIGLPQADCLLFWCITEAISKDLEEFVRNFRKFSKLLKPGGRIMFYGALNCTFYMVGEEKFHMVKYNESDLRSILSNEGFVITHLEVSQRKAESDLSDFDSAVFCTAYKEQKI